MIRTRIAPTLNEETHLVNGLQVRAKSTMNAEHAAVHDRPQGEIIKDLATPPPNV